MSAAANAAVTSLLPVATNWSGDSALVRGLIHARAGRQPYRVTPTLAHQKLVRTLMAGAAMFEFALTCIEDDAGMEMFVATRGPMTLSFENCAQVASWLSHLAAITRRSPMEVRSDATV